jgi:hypothetical protein
MLFILTLFSMVAIAVYNKGISKSQGAKDPEWQKRGGDASMQTAAPPGLGQQKQPNLRKEIAPTLPANDGIRKLEK